jgi:hypothetical protein
VSLDSAQRDVIAHQQQIAKLQQEKGREAASAADSFKKAHAASEGATRASSASALQSKVREAQRHQGDAVKHQNKVAAIEAKIAAEHKRLLDAQKKLAAEQERMARSQMQQQKDLAREQERQMRAVSGTLARHTRLHAETRKVVDKLQELPERITVLFLALDPRDQPELLLGEEARAVMETIRKSQHRDSVHFESRWAVRPLDVLQAINECRPRIVHFSGHGSTQDELLFQDDHGGTKAVTKAAIVQTMAATSGDIQLVFFNTCYSRGQAEAMVQHVPAAIGMNTAIGDLAARVFSAQLYSAIGFGHSINRAFEQAKAAVMLEGIPEESTPELFVRSGVDGEQLILVRPAADATRVSAAPATAGLPHQIASRRVDATIALVSAGNLLTSRMHFLLNTSKQATKAVAAHGYTASVRSSLQHGFDELEKALGAFDDQIEATQAAFPHISEPTVQLMMFRNLAYTVGAEWRWEWRTKLEGVTRNADPMEDRNPWDRFDWGKVFAGEDPDAGLIEEFALDFSRRMDSWATHVFDGGDPKTWWAARKKEERDLFAKLLESRASQMTDEQRADYEAVLAKLHSDA